MSRSLTTRGRSRNADSAAAILVASMEWLPSMLESLTGGTNVWRPEPAPPRRRFDGLWRPAMMAGVARPVAPRGAVAGPLAPKGHPGLDGATRACCRARLPATAGPLPGALAGRNFVPSLCPDSAPLDGIMWDGAGSNGSDLSKRFRGFGG